MQRWRFDGYIAGAGTASGTRLVLGHWPGSPFGAFSDVMVAHPDGLRELLAPSERIAAFVGDTYRFDRLTVLEDVSVHRAATDSSVWTVDAGPLRWRFSTGRRLPLGYALGLGRVVPDPIAQSRRWARVVTDPVARTALRGVRTVGTAGAGRTEWYAARDLHAIVASTATWDGADLGALRPVTPSPDFGFSSTPPRPALTRVVTTVEG